MQIMLSVLSIFKKIDTVAKKTKTPVYVVGGFVRDYLMGVEQKKDIDFVVVGNGIEFAKNLDKAWKQKGSLVEFKDFDTVRYIVGENEESTVLEFAGARSEKYGKETRKPTVEATTLKEDLARRDFTVNAMTASVADMLSVLSLKKKNSGLIDKVVIDLFNGKKDLKNKVLRTPLDPDKTFSDDPLRMMRGVRFAAQLGFSVEKPALEAIFRNRERLKIVSAERTQEELLKLLSCKQPSVGLILMFQTHLLDMFLPEVARLDGVEEIYGHQHKNNLTHTFKVIDNISERTEKVSLRLAGLLHDIGKFTTKKFFPKIGWTFYQHEHVGKKLTFQISRRLRFSKDMTDYLAKLVRWHQQPISLMDEGITDSAVRRLIVNLGEELSDLLILGRSDITTGNPYKKEQRLKNYDRLEKRIAEVIEKDKLRAFQSPLRGDEIMKLCGLKPGPVIGKIKEAIEEAILDGKIPNEYEAAKEYFFKIKKIYIKDK